MKLTKKEYNHLVASIMGLNIEMNGIARWVDILDQHKKVADVLRWVDTNTKIVPNDE